MIARRAGHSPRSDRLLKYWMAGVLEEAHLRYATYRGIHDWPFQVPSRKKQEHGQLVHYFFAHIIGCKIRTATMFCRPAILPKDDYCNHRILK